MKINERRSGENPWAVAKNPKHNGWKGTAPGLYFWYYRTEKEAKATVRFMKRKGKTCGQVEFRPNECYSLGYVNL